MKRNMMLLALLAFLLGSSLLVVWSRSRVEAPQPATPVIYTAASSAPKEGLQGTHPGNKGMTDQRGVPASSIGGKESRLDVVIDGQSIHLRNGGKVFLDDGLTVEVFLDPYPPTTLRVWLDLYLTRGGGSQAISDAEAVIEYDMRYMYHGSVRGKAKNLDNGHYLFTLDYLMYGAWDQLVTIQLGEKRYDLPLVVVAYP